MKIEDLKNDKKDIIYLGLESLITDSLECNFYSDFDIIELSNELSRLKKAYFEMLKIVEFNLLPEKDKIDYLKRVIYLKDSIKILKECINELTPQINPMITNLSSYLTELKDNIKL